MLALCWLLCVLFRSAYSAGSLITLGSELHASDISRTWSSPSNGFFIGFVSHSASPTTYTASISYSGGATIWTAGGSSTVVDSSASLCLTASGNLQLVNGLGLIVWESNTTGLGVEYASLNDLGNLVLWNNSGDTLWSSFANPTETLVPNQTFSVGQVLRSGDYSFSISSFGNFTLSWNNSVKYFNKWTNSSVDNSNFSFPQLEISYDGVLTLLDSSVADPVVVAYSSDYGEGSKLLRYLKLDFDGNLRIYSTDSGSRNNVQVWAAMEDQCLVFGYCGNLGVCSYVGSNSNPVCGCPSLNFEPIDSVDPRKGCKRKIEVSTCTRTLTVLELVHFEFLTYSDSLYVHVSHAATSDCGANCLINSCIGSTSFGNGSGICYLNTTDFLSGYRNPRFQSTSYLKVCGDLELNPPISMEAGKMTRNWKLWVGLAVIFGTLAVLIALEVSLWWCCCWNSLKFGRLSMQYSLLEYASGSPVQFSYNDLQRSTNGFKELLGEGGFGAVYKGFLAKKTVVAVKQLERIEQGEKQFRMEVATISSTHHMNLVRLIGFCSEGKHRLLVYEFMKNGSLDNFILNEGQNGSSKHLRWDQKFNIAVGTARGVTYLHEECRDCIIHCDLKPENILLDDSYNAKVSDFGLARLINSSDHDGGKTLTSVRGTRGYLAPEWLASLPVTSKSDVYSYGMVLLEIICGKRNFQVSDETGGKKLSLWAYEEFAKGNISTILDKRMENDHTVKLEQVLRAIQVSFWCIQEQPSRRPSMRKVLQMLEGVTEIERPPPPKMASERQLGSFGLNRSSMASHFTPSSSSSSRLNLGTSPVSSARMTDKASSSTLLSDV